MKNFVKNNGIYALISIFAALYLKLYAEMRRRFISGVADGLLNDDWSLRAVVKVLLVAIVIFLCLLIISRYKHLWRYVDKYRYIIGAVIIILVTIADISGSSIAMFHNYLGIGFLTSEEMTSSGTLMGVPRAIRTDDYATLTPMNFSQYYTGYNSTSDILRGSPTDVTTFYGNPSWALATLFRPFLWGYLILGSSRGLAFYWISRTVVLWLVSYELSKIITRYRKVLSATFACLVTFSQTIQWWYSTNGLVEMLIFGQLAIVLLYYLLHTDKIIAKVFCCFGIALSAGGYLLAYYPAQQVPLMYIWAILGIWVIIDARKNIKLNHILLIIGAVIVAGGLIAGVLYKSYDTISATMNTVYPGKRMNTGGDITFTQLFYYMLSIFTPIEESKLVIAGSALSNPCEAAVMYSLFPLGIIGAIVRMIRAKKADVLSVLLIIVELFLLAYCLIGFPQILATITLLNYSMSQRVLAIVGLCDILLLLRYLATSRNTEATPATTSAKPKIIITIILFVAEIAMLIVFYNLGYNPAGVIWLMAGAILLWLTYLIVMGGVRNAERFAVTVICVITITGFAVNPVQHSADIVLQDKTTQAIGAIVEEEPDARWIVVSDKAQVNNLPIMVGAKTINSTNTYPNLALWETIDPTHAYNQVYNRYAQIRMDVNEGTESTFALLENDQFLVNVSRSDLDKLDVSYIFSNKTLDNYGMTQVYTNNNYYIYKVK